MPHALTDVPGACPVASPYDSAIGCLSQDVRIRIPPPGGTQPTLNDIALPVDSIRIHPDSFNVNLPACTNAFAPTCADAIAGSSIDDGDTAVDVALVHLAAPVTAPELQALGVVPAKFIAGVTGAGQNGYTLDIPALLQAQPHVVIAGITAGEGVFPLKRTYALTTWTGLGWHVGSFNSCLPTETAFDTTQSPIVMQNINSGDGCTNHGDSGGPVFLNATAVGASSIPGLTPDTPYVAGFTSTGTTTDCAAGTQDVDAVSWDTADTNRYDPTGPLAQTGTGTLINQSLEDWDKDGFADSNDNCPIAYNPDQANCNSIAEAKNGFHGDGDACDPVFCAETTAPVRYANGGLKLIRDTLHITLLPSARVAQHDHNDKFTPDTPPITHLAGTDARFCQNDPADGLDCTSQSLVDDGFLKLPPTQLPDISQPWLPVTITEWAGSSHSYVYDGSKVTVHWDYKADRTSWAAAGYIVDAPLDGRLWMYTESSAGSVGNFLGTDYRVTPDYQTQLAADANGTQLSSNYIDIKPDENVPVGSGTVGGIHLPPIYYLPIQWPPQPLPEQLLGERPSLWWDHATSENPLLAVMPDGQFGFLRSDDSIVYVPDMLGNQLEAELRDPALVWRRASEPNLVANPSDFSSLEALAFKSDGTDIVDSALLLNGRVLAGSEVPREIGVAGDPPEPRRDFVPVFSRAENTAFVVGGHLLDGSQSHNIWYRPLDQVDWTRIALVDYTPDNVLAATWNYYDNFLWVLDERSGKDGDDQGDDAHRARHDEDGERCDAHGRPGHQRVGDDSRHKDQRKHGETASDVIRLVRLDPYMGRAAVVAEWEKNDAYDKYFLVVDRDGQVLLVQSDSRAGHYVVAQFEGMLFDRATAPTVKQCVLRKGTLLGEPSADLSGYTFVTTDKRGSVHVDRVSTLAEGKLASPPGLCKF